MLRLQVCYYLKVQAFSNEEIRKEKDFFTPFTLYRHVSMSCSQPMKSDNTAVSSVLIQDKFLQFKEFSSPLKSKNNETIKPSLHMSGNSQTFPDGPTFCRVMKTINRRHPR